MPTVELEFKLRGGNAEAWAATDREILVEGPRGTGKTRTLLEKEYAYCQKYPGLRTLIVRKYLRSIAGSVAQTLRNQVIQNGDGVSYFGGNEVEPASFKFKNGSAMVLGGLDDPEKLKSSEYMRCYFNEATEGTEDDWDSLKALLRQNLPGVTVSRQLTGDCNPTDSGHWLNRRAEEGSVRRIKTRLQDNPYFYNDDGTWTPAGEDYIGGVLESYKGARRQRWLEGIWTGVENACYPNFDRSVHIRPIEPGTYFHTTIIGEDYGSVHLCSVAVISVDQYNRRWVREVWAGADEAGGEGRPSRIDEVVGNFRTKYAVSRGRVDPNQAKLAKLHGFNVAKGGGGGRQGNPRLKRVDDLAVLLYTYEGGVVPTEAQIRNGTAPRGPFPQPDSPGFFLVEGAPGIDDLAAEMESYHFIFAETDKGKTKDVYRVNDDRIAAVEYANEEWKEGEKPGPFPTAVPNPLSKPEPEREPGMFRTKRKQPTGEWKRH